MKYLLFPQSEEITITFTRFQHRIVRAQDISSLELLQVQACTTLARVMGNACTVACTCTSTWTNTVHIPDKYLHTWTLRYFYFVNTALY